MGEWARCTGVRAFILVVVSLWAGAGSAALLPVDLGLFDADPTIAVAADGTSATLSEDPSISPVILGRSDLFIPTDAETFRFDFQLDVPDFFNEDFFDFFLGDLATAAFSAGGIGSEVFAGTVSTDLTGLRGSAVPVEFHLAFGFGDFGLDSTLNISNVQIETSGAVAPVPAPAPLVLVLTGMAGLLVVGTGRGRRAS